MQNPWRIGAAPKSRIKRAQTQQKKQEQPEVRTSRPNQHLLKLSRTAAVQKRWGTSPRETVAFLYGIPAPGILPLPVASSRIPESYRDIEFCEFRRMGWNSSYDLI